MPCHFTTLGVHYHSFSINNYRPGQRSKSVAILFGDFDSVIGRDDFSNQVEAFKNFYDQLFDAYQSVFSGPGHLLERMKGFWTYFSQAFKDGRKIRKKIHRSLKLPRYLQIVERFFEEEAEWIKG